VFCHDAWPAGLCTSHDAQVIFSSFWNSVPFPSSVCHYTEFFVVYFSSDVSCSGWGGAVVSI
jgi:hypothetical protein